MTLLKALLFLALFYPQVILAQDNLHDWMMRMQQAYVSVLVGRYPPEKTKKDMIELWKTSIGKSQELMNQMPKFQDSQKNAEMKKLFETLSEQIQQLEKTEDPDQCSQIMSKISETMQAGHRL